MISYRITKFDPNKRNQEGHYLDDSEWTAISDIGNPKYKNTTYQDYEKIETAYVESVKLILNEKNMKTLQTDSIELHNSSTDFENFKNDGRLKNISIDFNEEIQRLKENTILEFNEIDKIIRLILRETIWMNLIHSGIKIIFGYDYYMYVECLELKENTIENIEKMGLFVEPNIEQTVVCN